MAQADLLFKIAIQQGKTSEILDAVQRSVDELGAKSDKAAGKVGAMEKSMGRLAASAGGKLKSALLGAGGAILGMMALGKLNDIIGASIQAMIVQEDAVNAMTSGLRAQGMATDEVIDKMMAYNSSLQSQTRYGDEALASAQALGLRMGVNVKHMHRFTEATIGLAAAFKMDLESAAKMVALTGKGVIGELSEKEKGLLKFTKAQLIAGEGMDFLAKKFSKFARDDVDTFGGRIQQLQNTVGDLKEEIGFALVQGIKEGMGMAGNMGDVMVALRQEIERATPGIKQWAHTLVVMGVKALRLVAAAGREVNGIIERLAGAKVDVRVGQGAIDDLEKQREAVRHAMVTFDNYIEENSGRGLAMGELRGVIQIEEQLRAVGLDVDALGLTFNELDEAAITAGDSGAAKMAQLKAMYEGIGVAVRKASQDLKDNPITVGGDAADFDFAGFVAGLNGNVEAIDALTPAQVKAAAAALKHKQALEKLADKAVDTFNDLDGLEEAMTAGNLREQGEAVKALGKGAETAGAALKAALDAEAIGLPAYEAAMKGVADKIESVRQATRNLAGENIDMNFTLGVELGVKGGGLALLDAAQSEAEALQSALRVDLAGGDVGEAEFTERSAQIVEGLATIREAREELVMGEGLADVLATAGEGVVSFVDRIALLDTAKSDVEAMKSELIETFTLGGVEKGDFEERIAAFTDGLARLKEAKDGLRIEQDDETGKGDLGTAGDLFGIIPTDEQMDTWRTVQEEILAGTMTMKEAIVELTDAQLGMTEAVSENITSLLAQAQTQKRTDGFMKGTAQVVGKTATAFIDMAISGELSGKKLLASSLQSISDLAKTKAVEQIALGFGAYPDAAGMAHHFGAAALWGTLAVGAGMGAASMAGGGGETEGSSDGSGASSDADTASRLDDASDSAQSDRGPKFEVAITGTLLGGQPQEVARQIQSYLNQFDEDSGGRGDPVRG